MEQTTDKSLSKEHDYPQKDSEIRMWCVEMAFDYFGKNDLESAKKIYDFIVGKKEEQQESKN